MNIFKMFKKPPQPGHCGGLKCVDIVGRFNKETKMKIFYERPSADMLLEYVYEYQLVVEDDTELRSTAKKKNQFGGMAKRLIELIFAPYAEKIFHHCEGFLDSDGNKLEDKIPDEQFNLLKKYYSFYFADLCAIAFDLQSKVKKKD